VVWRHVCAQHSSATPPTLRKHCTVRQTTRCPDRQQHAAMLVQPLMQLSMQSNHPLGCFKQIHHVGAEGSEPKQGQLSLCRSCCALPPTLEPCTTLTPGETPVTDHEVPPHSQPLSLCLSLSLCHHHCGAGHHQRIFAELPLPAARMWLGCSTSLMMLWPMRSSTNFEHVLCTEMDATGA